MLPVQLRVLLLLGALLAVWVVANRVKKDKILIEDSIFWMVMAFVLLILAAFPNMAVEVSQWLGFMSPSNFVFLVLIALLLWKVFTNSSELSRLKAKVNELSQEVGLHHMAHRDDTRPDSDSDGESE